MATKNTAEKAIENFAKLREKALKKNLISNTPTIVSDEDYVIGDNFDIEPEIHIKAPSLESLIVFQENVNTGNALAISQALLGVRETRDLVRALDKKFGVNDAEANFVSIVLDVIEHFFGEGAGDVDGGFTV